MDPLNQTQSNTSMNTAPVSSTPKIAPEHKKVGPIVAILAVVLILVIGALYIFASKVNQNAVPTDSSTTAQDQSAPQEVQPVTNKSDDADSLQADLNVATQGLDGQNF